MGCSSSVLDPLYVEDLQSLTYLTKGEILHCYDRFRDLNEELIDSNPRFERVPSSVIIEHFPELKANPFADGLCRVFSSEQDGRLSFEDFLDMASAVHASCPTHLKAEWMFKVYDFDEDGVIMSDDIKVLLSRITGQDTLHDDEMESIVKHVMDEADIHRNGRIGPPEFRKLMEKSANFAQCTSIQF